MTASDPNRDWLARVLAWLNGAIFMALGTFLLYLLFGWNREIDVTFFLLSANLLLCLWFGLTGCLLFYAFRRARGQPILTWLFFLDIYFWGAGLIYWGYIGSDWFRLCLIAGLRRYYPL
jgi:hypothetical protein